MFLKEVIRDINANISSWEEIVLILPSNRSIREFKHLLYQEIKKPIFAPNFFTIESFIAEVSGLNLCDPLGLQLRFYETYQKNNSLNGEGFTGFASWANSVLSDFNEIDRYLIPPKEIFSYLAEISSIKNWSPNEKPTPLISEYTKFVKSFGDLYTELNNILFAEGLGYQGMLYRHAVKNIDAYLQRHTDKSFKIISLNALNKAEKTILKKLLAFSTTKIYWDIDNFFVAKKQHAAGYFIRQNLSFFDDYIAKQVPLSNDEFLKEKSIQITGVPKNISQAKHVGQLVQQMKFENNPVALVLADETLLPAILNSIPRIDSGINITMGYPIKLTQAYMFLKCILALKNTKQDDGLYYKDVQSFLSNPLVSCFLDSEELLSFDEKIRQKNVVYIKKTKLQELIQSHELLQNILSNQGIQQELDKLVNLFSYQIKHESLKNNKIEIESCSLITSALKELSVSVAMYQNFIDNDLEALIDSQLKEKTISFKGNPQKGLQIMGLLETRALDFDTVIMTSLNEGILPAGKSFGSFIPYDVKREFNLPTIKEKDAVYTYHFYRLLQRAKNIHLIYNTEPDVLKGGEPSRFIHQLTTASELKPYVQHSFSSPVITASHSILQRIDKTELLTNHLKEMALKGFSPSSLSSYIRNPYEFYKQYVLGIQPPEAIDEDVAYNVLGSIIHDSLEKLYQPLLNKKLKPESFEKIEDTTETIILSEFEKHYEKNSILQGKNFILYQVVQKYVRSLIVRDKSLSENHDLKIVALEKKLSLSLQLKDGANVVLKGKLDRVDEVDGQLWVIDYKTGTVENSGLNVTFQDDLFSNKKYDKAFQLLCYALLFQDAENKVPDQAAILPIKQLNKGHISLKVNKTPLLTPNVIEEFKNGLTHLIEEILNPEKPFIEKKD